MDQKKWVDISLGSVGLVIFWFFYKAIGTVSDAYSWNLLTDSPVSAEMIIGLIIGGVCFVILRKNKQVYVFTEEVVAEMAKVTWPARKETFVSGAVVLVMVGIVSLIMSIFDSVWGSLSQKILTF